MRQSSFHFYISTFTFLFLLSGCDSVKQTLGLNRSQPDEFMVVDRPALSIPPNLTLKPPSSVKTGTPLKRHQAQELILKPPASAYVTPSQAEKDLLSKANAQQSSTNNIRTIIEEDAKTDISSEKGLAEDMIFWKNTKPKGEVIDPIAEKERLQSSSKISSQDAF